MSNKIKSNKEVMAYIPDKAHIATVSFGLGGTPDYLLQGLHEYYKENQTPKNISLSTTAGIGSFPGTGADLLMQEGLLKRFYGSHIMTAPNTGAAALNNEIEFFFLPQGTIGQLYQDAARQSSGVLTQVGIDTFIDPDYQGGKINEKTPGMLAEKIKIDGNDWLYYKPWQIDVVFLKATYADKRGNLSFKHETNDLEVLQLATAAHHNGGIVIVQVEKIVATGTLSGREVKIPGALVDYIVVSDPKFHRQTFSNQYDPALSLEVKVNYEDYMDFPFSEKKVVARRAAQEISEGMIVNVGYGMPSEVSKIFAEEKRVDDIYLTTDLGAFGGLPASGYDYSTNYNAESLMNTLDMFALYQGGGLDACILGFGQLDKHGNMNSTELSGKLIGPGGMLDITHAAKKIIFIGTFSVGAEVTIDSSQVTINKEGKLKKFAEELSYVTFNAQRAIDRGQEIIIVTERAVFTITSDYELCVIEYAPGIDLHKDVIDLMPFTVNISDNVKEMDVNLFQA